MASLPGRYTHSRRRCGRARDLPWSLRNACSLHNFLSRRDGRRSLRRISRWFVGDAPLRWSRRVFLDGPGWRPFGFEIAAVPGQVVVVEAATNLAAWVPLQTNAVPDTGRVHFEETIATGVGRRFYRVRLQ